MCHLYVRAKSAFFILTLCLIMTPYSLNSIFSLLHNNDNGDNGGDDDGDDDDNSDDGGDDK